MVVEEDLMARRWRLRGDARMRVCVCDELYDELRSMPLRLSEARRSGWEERVYGCVCA